MMKVEPGFFLSVNVHENFVKKAGMLPVLISCTLTTFLLKKELFGVL
jgi:hypothetical protein